MSKLPIGQRVKVVAVKEGHARKGNWSTGTPQDSEGVVFFANEHFATVQLSHYKESFRYDQLVVMTC